MNQRRKEEAKNNLNPGFRFDLTGQVFGKLTVLEFDKEYTIKKRLETTSGYAWWKCQCECGKIVSISSVALRNGHTTSCGCRRKETCSKQLKEYRISHESPKLIDLTGQVFGKLTVLEKSNQKRNNKPMWICQCSCGNIVEVSGNNLRQKYTQSCGCIKKSIGEDIIKTILLNNNIPFKQEVKFDDLKDKTFLRFDFAILDKNNTIIKLIEFDGKQHSDPKSSWYSEDLLKHDKMKNEYCLKKGIPLLRISYKDIDKITLKLLMS